MFQVNRVMARQGLRFAWRRFRKQDDSGPELVREAFEELGGSFLKFGQILSLQIDTLPKQYCDALLSLLDRVPQFPADEVDEVFRQELGSLPSEIYAEFDPRAVASASIGQVHRARLKDGTLVAVKVQRPEIRMVFERDNALLRFFVRLIFLFRLTSFYFMRDPVRELSTWTQDELDYRREAAYAQLLGDNARSTPTERVPRIYWELTRTRVLTMDFLEGPSVSTYLRMVEENDVAGLAALEEKGFKPEVFSSNVISNFLSDAFRFGVFHADLHPANLLILPDNVVGYVDFGIVATLTGEARRKQIELTLAYSSGNPESIYDGFLNICIVGPEADLEGMRRRIAELAEDWYAEPAIAGKVRFRVTVTKTMMDLLTICQNYGVLVDREMIKYIRSTILADGMVSRLAPSVDLAAILRRVVEDYLEEEARRKIFSRDGSLAMMSDFALWLQTGPAGILHALNLFERRQFQVHASVANPRDKDSALRSRAIAAAAIWAVATLSIGMFTGRDFWIPLRFPAMLAGGFLALWTMWLLRMLQRLGAA